MRPVCLSTCCICGSFGGGGALEYFETTVTRTECDKQNRVNKHGNSLCSVPQQERNHLVVNEPITVTARSKASTVFARSNTGIVDSNTTRGMDVCVRLFRVCVVLCIGRGLATGLSPVQGVLPTAYRIKKLKSGQGATQGSGRFF
jgi:hypothetical protein